MYTAFVTDVYSRRIVGWALSDSMRTSGITAASTQPSDPSVRRKQQALFTIRITARSTSALSTTSAFPSTGSLLLLGQLATPTTMHWLKTLTALTRGELIHTRRWNDAVEVENRDIRVGVMVKRGKAPPKPGIPNPSRSGNRIVEEEPATGNNRNQGTCLGTKLGALQSKNNSQITSHFFFFI
nr:hypothetical protein [Corynebacterium sp. MSK156]MDK8786341.1 hypothetical protein [Corynebacterium sp. MSK156]